MGIQAVDLAIQNGVDHDGTPIHPKMLNFIKELWMRKIKENAVVLKNQ